MTASLNIPDSITGEPVLFTLETIDTVYSGTARQLAGVVDMTTLNITGGEKDGEGISMGNGGRAWKQGFQGDYTIEFDCYTVGVHPTSTNSMFSPAQFFDAPASLDATEAISTSNTRNNNRHRITFLQTELTSASSAIQAITTGFWAYRLSFANARITKYNYTFADGIWKISVALKVPAFNKSGTSNRQEDSGDGSANPSIAALATYTATVNF